MHSSKQMSAQSMAIKVAKKAEEKLEEDKIVAYNKEKAKKELEEKDAMSQKSIDDDMGVSGMVSDDDREH